MGTTTRKKKIVSVIIPAYNEERTIATVAYIASTHPYVDEVIIVDDGSTDGTAEQLMDLDIHYVRLEKNHGKAGAMQTGVEEARNDILFFIDADILGLTHEMMSELIVRVASGRYDMFVAVRDREHRLLNKIAQDTMLLGGERVMTKELWTYVPKEFKKNFQIETALNFFARERGYRVGSKIMQGLTQVIKEKKRSP
ncbi:glycosyltransferase family 2 protein, partial [Candidatus Parcubacteria bacterium]|nr:glycosyltransferase family 2 protein [Candidatus Parcubacteria bacterium]